MSTAGGARSANVRAISVGRPGVCLIYAGPLPWKQYNVPAASENKRWRSGIPIPRSSPLREREHASGSSASRHVSDSLPPQRPQLRSVHHELVHDRRSPCIARIQQLSMPCCHPTCFYHGWICRQLSRIRYCPIIPLLCHGVEFGDER
jgi:hypothetical protein